MVSYGQGIWLLSVILVGAAPPIASGQNRPSQTKPSQSKSSTSKPPATRIGPHRLGEGLEEWLAAENLSGPGQACRVRRQEVKTACEVIYSGLSKLVARFETFPPWGVTCPACDTEADESVRREARETCPRETNAAGEACDLEISKITSGGKGTILSLRDDKEYEWEFANGSLSELIVTTPSNQAERKLAAVRIARAAEVLAREALGSPGSAEDEIRLEYQVKIDAVEAADQLVPKDSDTAQEIKFLTEAYGPPSATKNIAFQNSYGAKWECPEITWARPDGASIVLDEYIINTDSGARKGVHILFISRDALNSLKNDEKPNPYK
jgi:hypothetical protein